jgi:hypothetical protein
MNMFGTGNPEEDELLKLLRQGLITPEQLEDMSAGQQAAQELRGGVSDTLIPMGSRRDTTVRAAASLQPETTATAQAPAQRASTPMESRSEGMKERSLTDMLKDRVSTATPMLDQRLEEDAQPRFVNTFKPRGYLPEEKAELSIRERARGKQDPKIAALNATPVERGLLPGERAEEEEEADESFDPSLGRYPEMPFPISETIVDAKRLGAEEDQQSLLSRIGSLIANNPEAVASGAQLIGGLVSNAAQNRAQRRADRTTDQRVARANLISAITGGRARPTVERAQADTGGFMSLDTLGKAFQGGGAAVKGELSRRVEEAERERKAGLDERAAELAEAQAESLDAYRKGTLGQREKEFNAQQELLKKEAEQALAEQGEVNLTQLRANVKDVDDALGLRKTGGYLDSSQGSKKLYNDMRVLFRQFEENPNPANINGIIQVYQRLFDPATVREGDVALLREAEGSIKQAVAVAQRLIGSGGTISTFTIEQMKKAADDVHAMQQAKAKADVRAYTSRLFSANERNVLDEYYDDIFSVRELPGEGEGSFISDLSGAKLNLD